MTTGPSSVEKYTAGRKFVHIDIEPDRIGRIFESANGGIDRALTIVSCVMPVAVALERLAVADPTTTTALNLSGSNTGNELLGNAGANVLRGRGGIDLLGAFAGNDRLFGGTETNVFRGGAGQDIFHFEAPLSGTGSGLQVVFDYVAADDTVWLPVSIYGAAGTASPPAAAAFAIGTAATTAAQRILYDAATGNLFLDADGVGAAAPAQHALETIESSPRNPFAPVVARPRRENGYCCRLAAVTWLCPTARATPAAAPAPGPFVPAGRNS